MEESPDSNEPEDHLPLLEGAEPGQLEPIDDEHEELPREQRADLDTENCVWDAMTAADRRTALREVVGGLRRPMPEGLVRLCCQAHAAGDRAMLNLAFEALTKRATPLLITQAWGLSKAERLEQVQEVLIKIFTSIRDGKAEFAARRFAAYTRRRAVEMYRARKSTWEGTNQRKESSATGDPLDREPCRASGPEFRTLISNALAKLPPKHAEAFIQYHHGGLTQVEIAEHHGVTDRTIRTWLNKAAQALGLSGEDYEL
jgi:RNA polymerase sigma factor (sigma-70 family)